MENNNQDSVNNQQNPQEFIKPEPQNNQQFSNINSQNSGNYTSSGEVVNNIVDNSQQQYINQAAQNQFKPQANKSDTLGLVSIILAFIGLQIIGIVLGIIGVKKGKKEGYKYTLSKVGIWINGVILLVVSLIVIAIAFVSVDNVSRNASDTSSENYLKAVSSSLEENFTVTKKYPTDCQGLVQVLDAKSISSNEEIILSCSSSEPSKNSNTFYYESNGEQYNIRYWSELGNSVIVLTH